MDAKYVVIDGLTAIDSKYVVIESFNSN